MDWAIGSLVCKWEWYPRYCRAVQGRSSHRLRGRGCRHTPTALLFSSPLHPGHRSALNAGFRPSLEHLAPTAVMPGIFHTITLEELSQWPKPNYVDPVERSWLSPFAIAWTIVSTALVAARIVLRIQGRSGTFGWDDVFIIIGWVGCRRVGGGCDNHAHVSQAFAVALAPIACILEWEYDIGRHTWDVPPEHYGPALYVCV